MISTNSLFRIITLAAILLSLKIGYPSIVYCTVVLGFMHYIMALVYSRQQIATAVSSAAGKGKLAVATLAGPAMFFLNFPIAVVSIVHHNFNEIYMRPTYVERSERLKLLRVSCVVFNSFVFCTILRHEYGLNLLSGTFYVGGVLVTGMWFLRTLLQHRHEFTASEFFDNCMYEVASLGLLGISMFTQVTIMHLFFYHFFYWQLYPVPKMAARGTGTLVGYTALTVGLYLVIASLVAVIWNWQGIRLFSLFMFFGFVHNTVSFALSKAQPSWLLKLFQVPARIAAAPVARPAETELAAVG